LYAKQDSSISIVLNLIYRYLFEVHH